MGDMEDSEHIARYLAEHTQLPLDEATEIYLAGVPWPIFFKELAQTAEQDAHATGVSVKTCVNALDQLCNLEGPT